MSHFFRFFVSKLTLPVGAVGQGWRGQEEINTCIAGHYKNFPVQLWLV